MSDLSELGIGQFISIKHITFEQRRRISVAISRLNKRYRNDKTPSTMVMDTENNRMMVVRYAGVLEKVGGRYLIPRNPINDL